MNECRVSIYRDPCYGGVSIMFWEQRNGKTYRAKPVALEMEEIQDGAACGPATLRLASTVAAPFLQALAEALDQQGTKTDSDATIAGTLKAQTRHLEDLRELLKLPK